MEINENCFHSTKLDKQTKWVNKKACVMSNGLLNKVTASISLIKYYYIVHMQSQTLILWNVIEKQRIKLNEIQKREVKKLNFLSYIM